MTAHSIPENETIALLRNSAAGFARFDSRRIRDWRGRSPGFDRVVWQQMAGQGWLSILVPEADGGLGLGIEAAAAVAEQLGRACYPEPFVMAGLLVPGLLAASTNQALKRALLPAALSGDAIFSLAWQPADGSLKPATSAMRASRRNGSIVLSGECRFIVPAQADHYLVLAHTADGPLLVCVDADRIRPGLIEESGPDGFSSAWLRLSDLVAPEAAILMSGVGVTDTVEAALDQAIIVQSAEICGLMQRALELTLDYMRTRQQFGVAIGSFQALQHRAVDLFIQNELARHAKAAAVRAVEHGAQGKALSLVASSAKSRAAHAGLLISTQAIQLHGAIGFTDEYDLGLYVNRMIRLAASLGNAAEHRRRFGDLSEGA
ncbi:acyl-CoA dehydrogenase family protein [Ferrovibrio sp.]|uniref:acyl-CoA dehydrogenase family protein n=1 Tax=Ferrovibrio sp. TaxID=1917215 RepID=UPI00262D11A7|nr:acyl-CoA dehydrogenase family protein [Ferrovibrio sp.]